MDDARAAVMEECWRKSDSGEVTAGLWIEMEGAKEGENEQENEPKSIIICLRLYRTVVQVENKSEEASRCSNSNPDSINSQQACTNSTLS